MDIQTRVSTIGDLIQSGTFRVPVYQRNYTWGAAEVKSYFEDLLKPLNVNNTADARKSTFVGPVVLMRESLKSKTFDIVDGQQRLTTTAIILAAFRGYVATYFEDAKVDVKNKRGLATEELFDTWVAGHVLQKAAPYLNSHHSIANAFHNAFFAGAAWGSDKFWEKTPAGANAKSFGAIKAAYFKSFDLIEKMVSAKNPSTALQELKFLQKCVSAILDCSQLLVIEVRSPEDALVLFQTLNDKGLKLKPADIIKAWVHQYLSDRDSNFEAHLNPMNFEDFWGGAVDHITDHKDSVDFNVFLRHWMLSRQGRGMTSKELAPAIKKQVLETPKVFEFMQDLLQSSEAYRNISYMNVSSLNHELLAPISRMSLLASYQKILIMKIVRHFPNPKGLEKVAIRTALGNIESFVFRNALASRFLPQVYEDLFADAAAMVSSRSLRELRRAVKSLQVIRIGDAGSPGLPTDEEIRRELGKREVRSTSDRMVRFVIEYYAASFEISGNAYIQDKVFDNPSNCFDIEHIFPEHPGTSGRKGQTAAAYWYERAGLNPMTPSHRGKYESIVYQWGNLTSLESPINRSYQDKPWPIKRQGPSPLPPKGKPGMRNSRLRVNIDFARKYKDLNAEIIELRTSDIINTLVSGTKWRSF